MTRLTPNSRFSLLSAWADLTGLLCAWFSPQTRWIIAFVAACMGLVGAVVFLIWAASGFVELRSIGLSGSVLAGLTIGIVVTAGLGAALMALVFQSDRDGRDEAVYRASDDAASQPESTAPTPALRE